MDRDLCGPRMPRPALPDGGGPHGCEPVVTCGTREGNLRAKPLAWWRERTVLDCTAAVRSDGCRGGHPGVPFQRTGGGCCGRRSMCVTRREGKDDGERNRWRRRRADVWTRADDEGVALCANLNLDPEELSEQWELYTLNKGLVEKELNVDLLETFRRTLKRKRRESNPLSFASFEDKLMDLPTMETPPKEQVKSEDEPKTPAPPGKEGKARMTPSPTLSSAEASAFKKRTQGGFVVASHVGSLVHEARTEKKGTTEIEEIRSEKSPDETTMFFRDRLSDKVTYLENRINDFAERIATAEKLPNGMDDIHPVSRASQEQVLCVGRICCDSEGKLNDQSVMLEGSMKLSNGARVKLELSKLSAFSFFPGQCVAVRGRNPSGHCLVAEEVIANAPKPMTTTSALEIRGTDSASQTFHMMVATGPYTTTEDMSFDPLDALLKEAEERKPDLLLLVGPFVDAMDPQLANGDLGMTFDALFAEKCQAMIARYCHAVGGQRKVVLVPSTRDVMHFPVFPQPPMGKFKDLEDQVLCLANPSAVKVRGCGLVVGCCSQDVLKHLAATEISRAGDMAGQTDRMSRLCSSIAGQASYYPLFPTARGCCFDASLGGALNMPATPDILVLPSDLAPFVKVVPLHQNSSGQASSDQSSFVCINPNRITKGKSGGTYASVFVQGLDQEVEGAPDSAQISHAVAKRSKVEIIRI